MTERKIKVEKITDHSWILRANAKTTGKVSKQSVFNAYRSEHSPIRSQIFWIDCDNIETFVANHIVRHHIGVEKFVQSQRIDRGGDEDSNRYTLTNMGLFINAQSLINMMKVRLCKKASQETYSVAMDIRNKMFDIDYELGKFFVPTCIYRNGLCPEGKSGCGLNKNIKDSIYSYYANMFD